MQKMIDMSPDLQLLANPWADELADVPAGSSTDSHPAASTSTSGLIEYTGHGTNAGKMLASKKNFKQGATIIKKAEPEFL